jgi:hypothetical protein
MDVRIARVRGLSSKPDEVKGLIAAARSVPNGEVSMVERRIAKFEATHGMSSTEMLAQVEDGRLAETSEIGAWLMALRLKGHLDNLKARPR